VSDDLESLAPRIVHKLLRDNRLETIEFLTYAVDSGRELLDGLVSHDAPANLVEKQRAHVADFERHLEKAEADLKAFDAKGPTFVP